MEDLITHRGGCHCGRVRFEVDAPAHIEVLDCNCSICRMTGFLHLIVPRQQFRLIEGQDALTHYQFGSGEARHLFCQRCGVKSFYVPRSHPDGFSVSYNCLDDSTVSGLTVTPFNGRDWDQARADLHEG